MQLDKKLKIVWFIDFNHPIYDYLCEAISQKNDLDLVVVLGYNGNKKTAFNKITILKKKLLFNKFFFSYYYQIDKNKEIIDANVFIVNNFSSIGAFQVYRLARKNNIKLIIAPEDKEKDQIFERWFFYLWNLFFGKRILNYASVIMPWSDDSSNFLLSIGVGESKIKKISLPINKKFFFQKEEKEYCPSQIIRFLCVARFTEEKDHKTLLNAFIYLKEKGFNNFSVSLIGNSGAQKIKIEEMVEESIVKDKVYFLDSVDNKEMINIYNNHDVLILPSKREAVGMVVIEAMACGLPVIASDSVGSRDCIISGENGFTFKAGDYVDLADKILAISKMNLEEMGRNGICRVKEKHDVLKVSNDIYNTIKNL